jgi:predicted dehydrogenase
MTATSPHPTGVGFVGAGPVTQAIHLPTLSRVPDLFRIAAVTDIDPEVAASVAARTEARVAADYDDLLADPAVEVVAICTPPFLHADQVIAAMEAGKKAVFCEKPLATSTEEAERIAEVAARTGVPLIVGAMHTFDPGWLAVAPVVEELSRTAHTVRSRIVLPFNDRFEDAATEVLRRPAPAAPTEMNDEIRAAVMSMAVLALAVHDLPLVRRFLPDAARTEVVSAHLLSPFGYAITADSGGRTVDIFGHMNAQWEPRWELEVLSADTVLHVEFTPSFVHAGSATASVTRADGVSTVHGPFSHNGYEGEWRAIADLVAGDSRGVPPVASLLEDLSFIVDLAAASAGALRKESA